MNKVFICGSLEPGRDGVGDYSRRLAAALIQRGAQVALLAFNDSYIDGISLTEQVQGEFHIPVLRIGKDESAGKRISEAKKWIDQWDPEWLSLQFVPYAFHKKGLPWRLGKQMRKIGRGRKWHIMFHELWVEAGDARKQIVALLQRAIIKSLVSKLDPLIAHTNLPIYRARLAEAGIEAGKLPLFSNITCEPFDKPIQEIPFTISFFSQFEFRKSIVRFLRELIKELYMEGLDFRILLLGGNESKGEKLIGELSAVPGVNERIGYTGFLNDNRMSEALNSSDLGISPVPRHLLGKSGSVAAFLSHGVPVAAPFTKRGYETLELGFFDQKAFETIVDIPSLASCRTALGAANAMKQKFCVSAVAEKFISDLKEKSDVNRHSYSKL
ncbi:MAG: hypothetical protein WBV11_14935 [Salegentibacter sp.]